MSELNLGGTSQEVLKELKRERLSFWAESIFDAPERDCPALNPRDYESGFISSEQESLLYRDLRSRDSDVGIGLLRPRRSELLDAIAYVRNATSRREHELSMYKSRLESLGKLADEVGNNAAAQEMQLRLEKLERDLDYLHAYASKLDSLERMMKLVGDERSRVTRTAEQMLRLFSQSWRGLIKIKAWEHHFKEGASLPHLNRYKQPGEPSGYLLPLGDDSRSVAVSREAAGYLLHLLESINLLAEEYREYVVARGLDPDAGWGPAHRLIRAIVELFYFCNFELPFSYVDLAVDPDDASQLWTYNYSEGSWSVITEDANSSRSLKRIAAEAAHILVRGYRLLRCRSDEELDRLVAEEGPQISSPGEAHDYKLFLCSGLSDFDLEPAGQKVKFRMAFKSLGRIFSAICQDQPQLTMVASSSLGGPLETLLGMALLDSRAFSFPAGTATPNPIARYQVLSQFWRSIGRRRAISMLGEDYVKQVTGGLASLGEQGPEHPTFLTMRVGTVVGAGKEGAVAARPASPFSVLGLADQIRFLDLTLQSWALTEEIVARLKEVHSQGKLRRVIESLPQLVNNRKETLATRFNQRWITSNSWQWSFFRSSMPVVWDFWQKLATGEAWDEQLTKLPPYQALGLLLKLFGDIVRVILVIELSDSELSQSLTVEAETAGQKVIQSIEGFLEAGERVPQPVTEAINFYYDPEIRFDSWLAFAASYKKFLATLRQDMASLKFDNKLLEAIDLLVEQIDILYPVRKQEEKKPEQQPQVEKSEGIVVIDEPLSEKIVDLLAMLGEDNGGWLKLKLLSLAAQPQKRQLVDLLHGTRRVIEQLLPGPENASARALLVQVPRMAEGFYNFLRKMLDQGLPSDESLIELRPQVRDYFVQLEEIYNATVALAENLPRILPEDRRRLEEYLTTAPQRSSGLPFLVLIACDRVVLDIGDFDIPASVQAERGEARLRAYMRGTLGAVIEEPSVEIFPIGSGRVLARPGVCIVTSSPDGFNPYWSDLFHLLQSDNYSDYVSTKFKLVAQSLASEFPGIRVLVS
ncbi:MAG: hypothetical protein RMM17_04860 [Acidobacteriota bacterium]|nr:hypothetical protein [Blastocatellia bacterium]MDW8411994.1 hypothetical protein [Acidobacteriota bacterium]